MSPTTPAAGVVVRRLLTVSEMETHGLADVLIDCVEGGASVSFMHPLPLAKALAFWRGVADGVVRGQRALLVAEDGDGIVGTAQLLLAQPENQPHRADVAKMLVHRRARRAGVGAALLRAIERTARECGRSLLVLDTASHEAARLYARGGWTRLGAIPGYALLPRGGVRHPLFLSSTDIVTGGDRGAGAAVAGSAATNVACSDLPGSSAAVYQV